MSPEDDATIGDEARMVTPDDAPAAAEPNKVARKASAAKAAAKAPVVKAPAKAAVAATAPKAPAAKGAEKAPAARRAEKVPAAKGALKATRGKAGVTASAAKPKARAKPADPLEVPLYKATGKAGGEVRLPAAIFGIEPHQAVMHQATVRQLANGRQGTAATKTRGEVRGGGAKPYRQKGTGRARHGSDREPSMVGGGTVFGPHPRSYAQRMPRRMRRLALRSALSVKAREGKVSVVEGFDFDEPRTTQMIDLLHQLGVDDTALLVLPAPNLVVSRSTGNIPWAKVIIAYNLNLYDILGHDRLIVTRDALELIEETFAAGRTRGGSA